MPYPDLTEAGMVKFVMKIPSDVNPYSATTDYLLQALRVSHSHLKKRKKKET